MRHEIEEKLNEKRKLASEIFSAWTAIKPSLRDRINLLTDQLVSEDNAETRGRIKELKQLLDFDKKLVQDIGDLENDLQESGQPENYEKELI